MPLIDECLRSALRIQVISVLPIALCDPLAAWSHHYRAVSPGVEGGKASLPFSWGETRKEEAGVRVSKGGWWVYNGVSAKVERVQGVRELFGG